MTDLLQSFLSWLKDPFGRRELISRHTEVINEIHTTQALVREANRYFAEKHPHEGVNAVHRAILGNRKEEEHAHEL